MSRSFYCLKLSVHIHAKKTNRMLKRVLFLFAFLPLTLLAQKSDFILLTKGSRLSRILAYEKEVDPTSNMYFATTNIDPHLRFTNLPDLRKYEVTTEPLIVERNQTGSLPLTIEYYYTKDSIVRAAIFYWKKRYPDERLRAKICKQEHQKTAIYKDVYLTILKKFSGIFKDDAASSIATLEKFPLDTWWNQFNSPKADFAVSLNSKFGQTDHEVTAWIYWK